MPKCKRSDLPALSTAGTVSTTEFYASDLQELVNQSDLVISLELRTTICPIKIAEHSTGAPQNHTVAIAISKGPIPMDNPGNIVALPCPPHCGGEKYVGTEKMTIADFLASWP